MLRRGVDTNVGEAGFCESCQVRIPEGPDTCLGTIPGVSHACCGHGRVEGAYVVLGGEPDSPAWAVDTVTLRGDAARQFFALVSEGEFEKGEPDTVWVEVDRP